MWLSYLQPDSLCSVSKLFVRHFKPGMGNTSYLNEEGTVNIYELQKDMIRGRRLWGKHTPPMH